MVMRTKRAFLLLSIVLLLATLSLTFFTEQHRSSRASGNGFPYVSGTQLIDASGNPLILRGTQVETSFMYASSWKTKNNVTRKLNPTVFYQMTTNWHMNVLRLSFQLDLSCRRGKTPYPRGEGDESAAPFHFFTVG